MNCARLLLLGIGVSIVAVFGVPAASALAACSETWTGASGDGMWTTAANWSPAVIPGNGNNPDVCLPDIGHSYTVTLAPFAGGGGYTVNSLTIGTTSGSDTETLQIVGQSFIFGGETQNGEGLGETAGATINATGSIVLDATAGGSRALPGDTLGGPASFGDPSSGGPTILNYGQIVGETSDPAWGENLNANITNEPGGRVDVASGSLDQETGGTLTNDGTVTVAASADYRVTSGGTIDDFVNNATLANNGTFETQGQSGTFTQNGAVTGDPVSIDSSNLADQSGAGTFTIENLGYGTPSLIGTIPAGQTVDVNGTSFVSGGETANGTGLNFNGTTVTNDGTLVLDATAGGSKALPGDTVGGGVGLFDGSLTNNGTLNFTVSDPAWGNTLEAALANSTAGRMTVSGRLTQDLNVPVTNHGTVTLAPSALYTLLEAGSFTNASDGTIVPQIASASSVGAFQVESPCCAGPGTVTGGGTVAPALVGGFTPTAGQEFPIVELNGGAFTGSFASVINPFTADYTKESATPATVDVVYAASSVTPTVDPTSTRVVCAPASLITGKAATCTATVTDTAASGPTRPGGTVSFISAPTSGSFGGPARCTLAASGTGAAASCHVAFTPAAAGRYTLTANYAGDAGHRASSATGGLSAARHGVLKIGASAVVSTHGVAVLPLTCTGATGAICTGRIKLTTKVKKKVRRRVHGRLRTVTVTKTVVRGSVAYTVTVGKPAKADIKLTRAGAKLLAQASSHRLRATASATPSAGAHISRTVTLIGPGKKKSKST